MERTKHHIQAPRELWACGRGMCVSIEHWIFNDTGPFSLAHHSCFVPRKTRKYYLTVKIKVAPMFLGSPQGERIKFIQWCQEVLLSGKWATIVFWEFHRLRFAFCYLSYQNVWETQTKIRHWCFLGYVFITMLWAHTCLPKNLCISFLSLKNQGFW